jgi:hypothetical protein
LGAGVSISDKIDGFYFRGTIYFGLYENLPPFSSPKLVIESILIKFKIIWKDNLQPLCIPKNIPLKSRWKKGEENIYCKIVYNKSGK